MKKFIIAATLAMITGAPALYAQDPGEGTEAPAETAQELAAKLKKLMEKASEEMGELEKELAKASLGAPKADVIAERMKKVREAMKNGELEEVPEGLKKYLKENPEEAAKLTGKSAEELKKLVENEEELMETLKKNPEMLKKLAESEDAMEKVLENQHEVERKLEESLKKQREAAESARKDVDESLNMAHKLRSMQKGQGQGKPKDNDQHTKDPRKKDQQQNGNNKPSDGAKEGYEPGEGKGPRDDETGDYKREDAGGFQADGKKKDLEDGASNDGTRTAPSKYKGFWEKWTKEKQKRQSEKKKDE